MADVNIEETLIPFGAVATDLIPGKQLILRQGSIVKAVIASCAVPAFMLAVSCSNMVLVDGGILEALPVRQVKDDETDLVIAVDVGRVLTEAVTSRTV